MTSTVNYIISRAVESEGVDLYESKSWLIVGKSMIRNNFLISHQDFLLERRQRNVQKSAESFAILFEQFHENEVVVELIKEITDAVKSTVLKKDNVKVPADETSFLNSIFSSLPQPLQIDLLHKRIQFDLGHLDLLAQWVLLLLKLYPKSIHRNPDLIIKLISHESEPNSSWRHLLVTEILPLLLKPTILKKIPSILPRLVPLLNSCIEYCLVGATNQYDCWKNLFTIADSIGRILSWSLMPFFSKDSSQDSTHTFYDVVMKAYENKALYSSIELAYVICIAFLHSICSYHQLNGSKQFLVEMVFPNEKPSTQFPPMITATLLKSSPSAHPTRFASHFASAVVLWDLILSTRGSLIGEDCYKILGSFKTIQMRDWTIFSEFRTDYQGKYEFFFNKEVMMFDPKTLQNPLKLASYCTTIKNYRWAVQSALNALKPLIELPCNLRFADLEGYKSELEDNWFCLEETNLEDVLGQRVVHFLIGNPWEIFAYAIDILISCFTELLGGNPNDKCLGFLMILLQMEWPHTARIFDRIIELIQKRNFFQCPIFAEYIIEPDFLETFSGLAVEKDFDIYPWKWSGTRCITGNMEKFNGYMKRQMMRNGKENIGDLVLKFLSLYRWDIMACF